MRERFLEIALANPVVATIVDRAPKLGLPEWYLTAGGLFQTVWNHIDGRDLGAESRTTTCSTSTPAI